jgi:putative ABC transport system permease protein
MFLVESMVMGLLGGLGGLLLGAMVGESVNMLMNALAHRFHGPGVNLFVAPLWFVLVIIAFSAIIGLLTGVYPSVRASKLNPLDALRYK